MISVWATNKPFYGQSVIQFLSLNCGSYVAFVSGAVFLEVFFVARQHIVSMTSQS